MNFFFRNRLFSSSTAALNAVTKEQRIFFGGFPGGLTEAALKDVFQPCGSIKSIQFFRKGATAQSKGYGTILFESEEGLAKAMELHGTEKFGKNITVKRWEGEFSDRPSRPFKNDTTNFPPSEVIYVGNLPFHISNDEVLASFSEFGQIYAFRRPYDNLNNRPKG